MKIGGNLLLWTARGTLAHLPVLRMLRGPGYDGVEVPVFARSVAEFAGSVAEFAGTGRMVAGEGLAVAVAGTLRAGADPLSDDAGVRQAGADHLRWLVDCAGGMGAEVIAGPFHQPLGQFSGAGITDTESERMVESQRAMADHAGALRRAIEPVNRFECYALTTCEAAQRLVAEVGRANYGYLSDTFHPNIEERDPVAALQATVTAVGHFHVSENDRDIPGRGHAAIGPALQALKAGGYDHWISVEAFGQTMPDIAAATKIWRPLFADETELVTEAIALIRQAWAN